ncbi:MAG: GatB/YqeY domain-containing protein, partial [Chloroflexi bacterium]|nr:GatB/YqeY domain-containing protein [Chloroflexota bacterium]
KGKVMGRLMPQVRGRADGTVVNDLVTQLLESGS